jgi:AbrB family looped-hinge helix DNA binding protein
VTAPVVPAIIPSPPSTAAPAAWAPGIVAGGARWRSPLPLVELPELGDPAGPGGSLVCGTAIMDCNGRLVEATVIAALGWTVGARLDIDVRAGLVVVSAAPDAAFTITQAGQVRLPAPIRHRCQLAAGDRLLLVADPDAGTLLVYPPRVWRTMISQFLAGRLDDGPGAP